MTNWNIQRAEEKKQELSIILSDEMAQSGLDNSFIAIGKEKVFSNGINISPPEKPEFINKMLTMESFHSNSESTKPGNIRMNVVDFLESIGTGVITFAGGLAYPWLYLLGFLLLWKQLWDCATIEIREKESKVLWSMWELKKENQSLTLTNIVDRLDVISRRYNVSTLKKGEVAVALTQLEKIDSIKRTPKDEWRIVEWINVKYQ